MSADTPHFPEQVPIDAYGNGGFRFAGGSHRGSLLFLPSGVYGWPVASLADISPANCAPMIDQARSADFVLLGTGDTQLFPSEDIMELFVRADLGLEVMDTGAAARTYNLMMEEKRAVMAALIAVD